MSAISEREARSQGENAALALRHRLRLGNDPADLDEIAADLGVLITRHAFGAPGAWFAHPSACSRALPIERL